MEKVILSTAFFLTCKYKFSFRKEIIDVIALQRVILVLLFANASGVVLSCLHSNSPLKVS